MRAKQGAAISGLIPISETDTVASTITALQAELVEFGVSAGAYHMTPPFHSQVSKKTVFAHFGMSASAIQKYLDPAVFENDPVPDYVMTAGRTMSLTRILSIIKVPPAINELIEITASFGFVDAICMPLFGPNSRNSYAFLLLTDHNKLNDNDFVKLIFERHESYHTKICTLIVRDHQTRIKLSEREREVILWIARGKSNQDIAAILEISSGTVDTYVRRLYSKLGVNDRVSAVIESISRGLFHL